VSEGKSSSSVELSASGAALVNPEDPIDNPVAIPKLFNI
jgi:hypothetical protein